MAHSKRKHVNVIPKSVVSVGLSQQAISMLDTITENTGISRSLFIDQAVKFIVENDLVGLVLLRETVSRSQAKTMTDKMIKTKSDKHRKIKLVQQNEEKISYILDKI